MTYRMVYRRYRIVECGPGVAYDLSSTFKSGRTLVRPDCGTASFYISPNRLRRRPGSIMCIMFYYARRVLRKLMRWQVIEPRQVRLQYGRFVCPRK
jgi:hypothetical protein